MLIQTGPTGKLVQGHVLDVNLKAFTETLKFYDPQLYVKWNPNKLRGWGCWEIRRKPEFTSIKEIQEFEGNTFILVDYVENDIINHVLDCAFLNYDQLRKLKSIDTWSVGPKQWIDNLDYMQKRHEEHSKEKAKKAMKDAAKTFKKEINALRDYVQSGNNPHLIAAMMGNTKELD